MEPGPPQAGAADALQDPLTGLPNRVLFRAHLERCAARARRNPNYAFAVLFLDIDRFKMINDRLSHAAGDALLVEIAQRLVDCVRSSDVVARHGGDEFTILLDDVGELANATRVADQMLEVVSIPFIHGAAEIQSAASIGITLNDRSGDPDRMINHADLAMYRAKARGRSRLEVFDEAMYAESMARIALERELRRAVERQEFMLTYQPIVEINSGRIMGFEAFIRWKHPERGALDASEFLVAANTAGIMATAGHWILREACAQAATWQRDFPRDPPVSISVNLSAKELNAPGFVARVGDILADTGLAHDSLRLELTERTMGMDADRSFEIFARLHDIGVRMHLDNFGDGAASLSCLYRYPVRALKIDRGLIARMGSEPEQRDLVQAISCVAGAMKIDLIAEGVETAEQMRTMRESGQCTFAQGYHIARPMSAAAATSMLMAEGLSPEAESSAT